MTAIIGTIQGIFYKNGIMFLNITRHGFYSRVFSKAKEMENNNAKLDRYIWMDLEMTGLDAKKDAILEVACVITTTDLNLVHQGLNLVIHQPENVLDSMNDWSTVQHSKTGLTMKSRESKISLEEADKQVSEYIKNYSIDTGIRYLAGNSVFMDKLFIDTYMPITSSLLHYRLLDVTTLRILCSHWYFDEYSKLPKIKKPHRALSDILKSIEELKNYQKVLFRDFPVQKN